MDIKKRYKVLLITNEPIYNHQYIIIDAFQFDREKKKVVEKLFTFSKNPHFTCSEVIFPNESRIPTNEGKGKPSIHPNQFIKKKTKFMVSVRQVQYC
jgi:hypothetical protein